MEKRGRQIFPKIVRVKVIEFYIGTLLYKRVCGLESNLRSDKV